MSFVPNRMDNLHISSQYKQTKINMSSPPCTELTLTLNFRAHITKNPKLEYHLTYWPSYKYSTRNPDGFMQSWNCTSYFKFHLLLIWTFQMRLEMRCAILKFWNFLKPFIMRCVLWNFLKHLKWDVLFETFWNLLKPIMGGCKMHCSSIINFHFLSIDVCFY